MKMSSRYCALRRRDRSQSASSGCMAAPSRRFLNRSRERRSASSTASCPRQLVGAVGAGHERPERRSQWASGRPLHRAARRIRADDARRRDRPRRRQSVLMTDPSCSGVSAQRVATRRSMAVWIVAFSSTEYAGPTRRKLRRRGRILGRALCQPRRAGTKQQQDHDPAGKATRLVLMEATPSVRAGCRPSLVDRSRTSEQPPQPAARLAR